MLNGVNKLVMMKSDVLDSFDTIKVCVSYNINGEESEDLPFDSSESIDPNNNELPGWKTGMTSMRSEHDFPEEFNNYITFLEEELGVPISIVSLGPDRAQTIIR